VASYRRIEVKPIAGALGAEIANVDLGTLDDETFREIEAAWLERLVVFFRNQTHARAADLLSVSAKSTTTRS
jgi:alpha-ketoglutarate-dependent taurine dioxygenase